MLEPRKFSLIEMTNNSRGKTSPGIVCGVAMILTACIGILWSINIQFDGGVMGAGAFAVSGAGLLGIRRFTADKDNNFIQKNLDNG